MKNNNQKLTKKHKIVVFLIIFFLLIIVSVFVFFMFNLMDNTLNRQPRKLSRFINHSITLKILNKTNKPFILNKIVFPKDFYYNLNYNKNNKKLYGSNSINIKNTNSLIKKINFNNFLNTKIPLCKIDRSIFNNFKGLFNINKPEEGLTIILESNDNQSSTNFTIIHTNKGYKIKILQISKNFVELAPRNIHTSIDTFKCSLKNNSKFLNSINKLVINSI